jgi:carbamoyl-phosphate synthase large subunit
VPPKIRDIFKQADLFMRKNNKMNVLLTAIGSMSAESVISSLREVDNIKIVGCDIYAQNWIPTSQNVDIFYQVPKAFEKEYIPTIKKICKNHKVDFVFPLSDPEVDVLVEEIDLFKRIKTRICVSDKHAIQICRNKLLLHKFFRASKVVKTIPTFNHEELYEDLFKSPVMAKRVNGRSSEGIRILSTIEEIKYFDYSNYVFQPYLTGDIFTVDYIRDTFGNDFSITRKELLRTINGAGLTVEINNNEALSKMVSVIGNELNIIGCVNMEFLFNGKDYLLMDINPRFSAGIAFSAACGYNFAANNLSCFNKKSIDSGIIIKPKLIAKKFTEVIM